MQVTARAIETLDLQDQCRVWWDKIREATARSEGTLSAMINRVDMLFFLTKLARVGRGMLCLERGGEGRLTGRRMHNR